LSGAITDQQLMLKQERFRGYGAYTARAEQLREGHQEVDEEDEEFAHPTNTTITAGPRKTARRGRIASHYEFGLPISGAVRKVSSVEQLRVGDQPQDRNSVLPFRIRCWCVRTS
jgi:hypothetical protein